MLRGLWQLTWLEIKIFLREPLGAIGTHRDPGASLFVVLGRVGRTAAGATRPGVPRFIAVDLPVFAVAADRAQRGAVARRRSSRSTARAASSSGCARRRCGRTRS